MMLRTLAILLLLLLPQIALGAAPTAAAATDPMALPPALREALERRVIGESTPGLQRIQRLLAFMLDKDSLALRYREQPTYDVAGSYQRRSVNCLSFTLMFIALARASGMQAYAQASTDALSLRLENDTMFRTTHMNAGVRVDGGLYTVDVGSSSVVAGLNPRPIDDAEAIALFHNNHAVERLLAGDAAGAAVDVAQALALDAANATIWSNAGVIHWRAQQRAAAERAYLQALQLKPQHLGALANIVAMYAAVGDTGNRDRYRAYLAKAERRDPFSQFVLAKAFADAGDDRSAIAHFRRAIRLLPGEPRFYRELAEAYQRAGDPDSAQRAAARAAAIEADRAERKVLGDSLDASS